MLSVSHLFHFVFLFLLRIYNIQLRKYISLKNWEREIARNRIVRKIHVHPRVIVVSKQILQITCEHNNTKIYNEYILYK